MMTDRRSDIRPKQPPGGIVAYSHGWVAKRAITVERQLCRVGIGEQPAQHVQSGYLAACQHAREISGWIVYRLHKFQEPCSGPGGRGPDDRPIIAAEVLLDLGSPDIGVTGSATGRDRGERSV